MKTISKLQAAVARAINTRNNVKRVDGVVEMMECTPMLKPSDVFDGYKLGHLLHNQCPNMVLSGSRLLEENFFGSSTADIDIFFTDSKEYSKAKDFISGIAHKKAVTFEPHYYYNYDVMQEIGRYEVMLRGVSVSIDLVLVDDIIERDEAIAMSLLKGDKFKRHLYTRNFEIAREIAIQLSIAE